MSKEKFQNTHTGFRWLDEKTKFNEEQHSHLPIIPSDAEFHRKCVFNSLTLKIGDFVLISDTDSDPRADIVQTTRVAKIIYFFEDISSPNYNNQVILNWYERPDDLSRLVIQTNCNIDPQREVIEGDLRCLETVPVYKIFQKCQIIFPSEQISAAADVSADEGHLPMYVCRYKIVKSGDIYKLVPIIGKIDENIINSKDTAPIPKRRQSTHTPARRNSALTEHNRRSKTDLKRSTQKNVVSPLKIIKLCSAEPEIERNHKNNNIEMAEDEAMPTNRRHSAKGKTVCRNLSTSLNCSGDGTSYSVVENFDDDTQPNNDILKIKLKAVRNTLLKRSATIEDIDPLSVSPPKQSTPQRRTTRKLSQIENVLLENIGLSTPKSKRAQIDLELLTKTPENKNATDRPRRSILKTPGNRNVDTPKRNIAINELKNETKLIRSNSKVLQSTPQRRQSIYLEESDEEVQKSTPKSRRSHATARSLQRRDESDDELENSKKPTPKSQSKATSRSIRRREESDDNIDDRESEKSKKSTPKSQSKPTSRSMRRSRDESDDNDSDFEPEITRKSQRKPVTPSRYLDKSDDASSPEKPKTTPKSSRKTASRSRRHKATSSEEDSDSDSDEPKKTKRSTSKQPSTPKSSKLKQIRSGELTPSIASRDKRVAGKKSDIQLARESLHVSAVPKSLVCRETEFSNICSFVESKIVDKCGGCMYISGVPGTGKTATVTEVIRTLKKKSDCKKLPEFEFIEINGMRLTEPRQAYVHIYKQLYGGKTIPWEQAHALLEKRFSTNAANRKVTVLLVDELDILCNKRQDVVYNLLDWPSKSAAQLVVITIANTMDLPERLLIGKVTSRLGLTRLTFQPYSHKQLQEVVMARLTGTNVFKGDAVQLVARKVASVSGDCRRALDICRRAAEIAELSEKAKKTNASDCLVSMAHVQQALAEMFSSAKVQAIKYLSKYEKVFMQAIAAEVARTGVEEVNFLGVFTQFESIAALFGITDVDVERLLFISCKLGASRLIICEHSRTGIYQKILLNVSSDDIHYALHAKL